MLEQGTPFAGIIKQARAEGSALARLFTDAVIMMISEVPVDIDTGYDTQRPSELESVAERQTKALEQTPAHGLVYFLRKRPDGVFPDKIGLGRTRNVDICIPSGKISKYHAYFSRSGDGTWSVTDASSKNGTFIAKQRLVPGVPHQLRSTQSLGIAGIEFAFYLPADFLALCQQSLARPQRSVQF